MPQSPAHFLVHLVFSTKDLMKYGVTFGERYVTFGTDPMDRAFSPQDYSRIPGPLAQAGMRSRRWRYRAENWPNPSHALESACHITGELNDRGELLSSGRSIQPAN
jgi:hypothetical protein